MQPTAACKLPSFAAPGSMHACIWNSIKPFCKIFYNQTAGEQRGSKGPTQAEFEVSTKLLVFDGKPVPKPRPQLPQQAQQQQQQQQQAFGLGSTRSTSLSDWRHSRHAELASSRGVKRATDGDLGAGSHAAKRGKYADEV